MSILQTFISSLNDGCVAKEAIKTYISDFVCGIGFTIFAEVVAAIIWAIYDRRKKEKEDERK